MRLEILGAESLGVRSLCCRVETAGRVIVIDPGLALGEWRQGLPPHPLQVALGRAVRRRIVQALADATDIVFSHFHGDHVPLADANPYQLALAQLPPGLDRCRVWAAPAAGPTPLGRRRAEALRAVLGTHWRDAAGLSDGPLCFSPPVPHGATGSPGGKVMMTCIDLGGRRFVHASDIQLLDAATIDRLLAWRPTWLIAAGPPLYRGDLDAAARELAWTQACRLAAGVGTLILDHHLLRSLEGEVWLARLAQATGRRVHCAADVMGRQRQLLEARRPALYAALPVRLGWHADHARGMARIEDFAPAAGAARVAARRGIGRGAADEAPRVRALHGVSRDSKA